jgi:hypothetical protein
VEQSGERNSTDQSWDRQRARTVVGTRGVLEKIMMGAPEQVRCGLRKGGARLAEADAGREGQLASEVRAGPRPEMEVGIIMTDGKAQEVEPKPLRLPT